MVLDTCQVDVGFPEGTSASEVQVALDALICALYLDTELKCSVRLLPVPGRALRAQKQRIFLALVPVSDAAPSLGAPTIDATALAALLDLEPSTLSIGIATRLLDVDAGVEIRYHADPTGEKTAAAQEAAARIAEILARLLGLGQGDVLSLEEPMLLAPPQAPPPFPPIWPAQAESNSAVGAIVGGVVGGLVGLLLLLLLLFILLRRRRHAAAALPHGKESSTPPPLPPGYDDEDGSMSSDEEPVSKTNERLRELERRIHESRLADELDACDPAKNTPETLNLMALQYTEGRRASQKASGEAMMAGVATPGSVLRSHSQVGVEAGLRALFEDQQQLELEQGLSSPSQRAKFLRV